MGLRHPVISVLESENNCCLNVDYFSTDDGIRANESTDERIRARVCQYHCPICFLNRSIAAPRVSPATIAPQMIVSVQVSQRMRGFVREYVNSCSDSVTGNNCSSDDSVCASASTDVE